MVVAAQPLSVGTAPMSLSRSTTSHRGVAKAAGAEGDSVTAAPVAWVCGTRPLLVYPVS
jgi:hypothetical protein